MSLASDQLDRDSPLKQAQTDLFAVFEAKPLGSKKNKPGNQICAAVPQKLRARFNGLPEPTRPAFTAGSSTQTVLARFQRASSSAFSLQPPPTRELEPDLISLITLLGATSPRRFNVSNAWPWPIRETVAKARRGSPCNGLTPLREMLNQP